MTAQDNTKLRVVSPPETYRVPQARPTPIYISAKMQVVIRTLGMPLDLASAKAAKVWYDETKKTTNLASITLIQIEVENALVLATRGAYKRGRRG